MRDTARMRRRLSMTSLIDVIFLLLLFFMLSSTFTRFAEVEILAGQQAGRRTQDVPPMFLQLSPDGLTVNGAPHRLDDLQTSALARATSGTLVLLSLRGAVDAQRLTDALIALRRFPGLSLTVLGR
ncbi:biopolymer transporter ExbD [Roseobacter sinensis]|uniref:Biopolymer transporter ExbD n=1 Tax=Roseobacter sinensis TaxID=2931391 RepID=A0ABT3BKC5_9RHOB|nr:biopolymer transporter ExbD [Roseobacter sp. WL0113]MCV3274011.1 biopolymer transporter ExbD [Roseobacter sp. WL0113]